MRRKSASKDNGVSKLQQDITAKSMGYTIVENMLIEENVTQIPNNINTSGKVRNILM